MTNSICNQAVEERQRKELAVEALNQQVAAVGEWSSESGCCHFLLFESMMRKLYYIWVVFTSKALLSSTFSTHVTSREDQGFSFVFESAFFVTCYHLRLVMFNITLKE